MKRLMISALAAVALFAAATTMLRSHTTSDRPCGCDVVAGICDDDRRQQVADREFRGSVDGLLEGDAVDSPVIDWRFAPALNGNSSARNLRRDQECCHDRRYADESQELIDRKHPFRPLRWQSRPCQPASVRAPNGLLATGQPLIGVGRSRNREQRQNRYDGQRFHARTVVFDCGRKCQSSARFRDRTRETSWPPRSLCAEREHPAEAEAERRR